MANVQTHGREIHVSSYLYADDPEAEQRVLPCDTLAEAIEEHDLALGPLDPLRKQPDDRRGALFCREQHSLPAHEVQYGQPSREALHARLQVAANVR